MALLAVAGSVIATASSAAADTDAMDLSNCAFAKAPEIPDGATATPEAMSASATAVRSYMGAMQDSLDCLESAEKGLGKDITDEQKLMVTAAYNSGVDQLNTVAENYNRQVRAFKNR
ncbi:MAG: hypothetical protein AAGI15_09950 [Pseudomonadota bacterium]